MQFGACTPRHATSDKIREFVQPIDRCQTIFERHRSGASFGFHYYCTHWTQIQVSQRTFNRGVGAKRTASVCTSARGLRWQREPPTPRNWSSEVGDNSWIIFGPSVSLTSTDHFLRPGQSIRNRVEKLHPGLLRISEYKAVCTASIPSVARDFLT